MDGYENIVFIRKEKKRNENVVDKVKIYIYSKRKCKLW
jgi:hypothetical protein